MCSLQFSLKRSKQNQGVERKKKGNWLCHQIFKTLNHTYRSFTCKMGSCLLHKKSLLVKMNVSEGSSPFPETSWNCSHLCQVASTVPQEFELNSPNKQRRLMRLCRKKIDSFLLNRVNVMRQSMPLWMLRLNKKQAAYATSARAQSRSSTLY